MIDAELKRLRETEYDEARSELVRLKEELARQSGFELAYERLNIKAEEHLHAVEKERDEARAEVERLRHALYDAGNRIAKYHHTECDCRWCDGTDLPNGWQPA